MLYTPNVLITLRYTTDVEFVLVLRAGKQCFINAWNSLSTEMVAKHWHNKCAHRGCTVARNAELFYPIGILETQLRPLWNIPHLKV